MSVRIEESWKLQLQHEFEQPYWEALTSFVRAEYAAGQCCPAGKNIFRAFDLTPFDDVKVVILGQDPYHTPGAAMGFCFSVPDGNRPQPSLQNIFQELHSDLGLDRRQTDLTDWAQQGVFLLNSVLTVRARVVRRHGLMTWPTKSTPRSTGCRMVFFGLSLAPNVAGSQASMSACAWLSQAVDSCSSTKSST